LGKLSQEFKLHPRLVYSSVRRNYFMRSETCAAAVGPHIRLVEANVSDKTDEIERLMISLPEVVEIPLSTEFIFPYIYRYLSKSSQDLSIFHSPSASFNLLP
jgi:hypothetical protein